MNEIFAFGMPGTSEGIVILLVVLLLFGAKRLPELARGVGKSIREFKKATNEVEENIREAMKDEEKKVSETKVDSASETSKKDGSSNS